MTIFTTRRGSWLGGLMFFQLALTIGVPLLIVLLWSLSDGWFTPSLLPHSFTDAHWRDALADSLLRDAALSSIAVAVSVTAGSAVLAVAPALVLSQLPERTKRIVEIAVLGPLIVPGIVIATGVAKVLVLAHLNYTWLGVVLAQLLGILPLMIRILTVCFENVPAELIAAARSLGAGSFSIVWRVVLPLSRPGVIAGCFIAFAASLEEFDKTFVVGAPNIQTLPVLLYFHLDSAGIMFPAAAVASFILLLPGSIIFLVATHLLHDHMIVDGGSAF